MAISNPYNYSKPKNMVKSKEKVIYPHLVKDNTKLKNNTYLTQKILSARPEQLTLMLYDGLVKFLKKGKLFIGGKDKNVQKANTSFQRAQAILDELRRTLDMDIEISENLDILYEYMINRTKEANMGKDIEIVEEIIGLSEELRDTWEEAINSL